MIADTRAVRAFVKNVSLEDCFKPETWRALPVLVQVEPDGEIFPARADYPGLGNEWQIGVNHVESDRPLWYALPDVVAAKLLSGRAPKIVRALRLVPSGKLPGLRPVSLRGEVEVDPVGAKTSSAPSSSSGRACVEAGRRQTTQRSSSSSRCWRTPPATASSPRCSGASSRSASVRRCGSTGSTSLSTRRPQRRKSRACSAFHRSRR